MFCVVVHAVRVPEAVWTDDWKALAPERSADVRVIPIQDPAEAEAHHEKLPPDGVYASKAVSQALRLTDCPAPIESPNEMSQFTAIV